LGAHLCLASISEKDPPVVYTSVGHSIAQKRVIGTGDTSIYYIPCDGYRINSAAVTRYGTTFVCCSHGFMNVYKRGQFDAPQEVKAFKIFGSSAESVGEFVQGVEPASLFPAGK
jgi:hypothetical protein